VPFWDYIKKTLKIFPSFPLGFLDIIKKAQVTAKIKNKICREGDMANILVCDDDREIVDAIEIYLLQEGYTIYKAYDGEQAIKVLKEHPIHLLLIDVMMPRLDGIHATLKIREYSSIPIIILSAKSEDNDKILGLNIGADDYVTKPFNPLELLARVKSNLRRYTTLGNLNTENNALFQVGGLCINDDTKEVTVDGDHVKLTPIEYNILLLLVKNCGRVFSIDQIYESIWNEEAIGADNTVAVHIRHIREKIEINPKEPRYLKVVWGVGYKIEKQ
jgi:DNA-binding response OmpR family regulator